MTKPIVNLQINCRSGMQLTITDDKLTISVEHGEDNDPCIIIDRDNILRLKSLLDIWDRETGL